MSLVSIISARLNEFSRLVYLFFIMSENKIGIATFESLNFIKYIMRKITLLIFVFGLLCGSLLAKNNAIFVSEPSLSPNGNDIIFVYESDLWKVSSKGGLALRLTAMEGIESNPRVSPDGKWLAFTATQSGNADIFIMPMQGGEITQLTYSDGSDKVDSWSWNSNELYFTSNRYNQNASYKISRKGGTPSRLFTDNYHNNPHHIIRDPKNGGFYFTESWESSTFPHRKRYKGAHNPDIKFYNPKSKEYKELTSYEGKDFWPTIDENGTLYFVSDQANNEYNLYQFENGSKKQLTSFESSIERPQVSANGQKVVFTKDYQIHLFDVQTQKVIKPEISLVESDYLTTTMDLNVEEKITNFDISADQRKIVFVSRGRIFVSDIKGQFVRELNTEAKERVIEVKWLKDNKSILYTRTVKGWANLFTMPADQLGKEKQLTNEDRTVRQIEMNAKRTEAVYISGNDELKVIKLKNNKSSLILKDEFWFRSSQPYFSPDGRYLLFTAYRNFEQDIFIYDLKLQTKMNITDNGVAEGDPYWSPDGKYIYFHADRYKNSFPRGTDNSHLYRIPLYRFTEDFKSDKYDELFTAKEEKKKEDKKEDKEKEKDETSPQLKLDLRDLSKRWESLGMRSGQQFSPIVMKNKDKTLVLFQSNHENGRTSTWKMTIENFKPNETKQISSSRSGQIVVSKQKAFALIRGKIHELKLSTNKSEAVKIKFAFSKVLNDEFVQMYYENWAIQSENFYDGDFHGVDWDKVLEENEKFLPAVQNRANLRKLLNDMLGELNASHLSFYSNGKEEEGFYKQRSISTGIVFNNENPYTVERIVDRSPLDLSDFPVQAGDELIEVNNERINLTKNRESYFTFAKIPEEISLKFVRNGVEFEIKIHPITRRAFGTLLYDEWIENNQKRVDKATDKKVAYVMMKDMSGSSLNNFLIDMTTEAEKRDALILDLRYNRGGNVHDDVLQFLSQKSYLNWKQRGGQMAPQPNFSPSSKPIVLLLNEHSLSDAEMMGAGFKELGLGTIIGTETYRWIIFTSGKGLVDGSFTRLPSWGCFDLNGKDLEKTGVAPDIYVKNKFTDRVEGKDPQLDKAIEYILQKMKK